MHRFLTCGVLFLAFAVAAGCGPDPEVVVEQEREGQWAAIETTRQQLDAKRGEVEQARAAAGESAAEPEAGTADAAAPTGDVAALEAEAAALAEQFNQQLVDFINANPPVVGEPPPERVQQAIRLKSDEDIRIALEYIEEGGDYRRAIDIYEAALLVDPDYERLQQLRAEALDRRYITEERFAQVEKGMTRDQVRELLGPVHLRNVRDYQENQAVAWFYPRDERGSAAAVWFNKNRRGEYVVYQLEFNFKNAGDGDGEA